MGPETGTARRLLEAAPHVAMKDPAFAWPFDDLGQFTGDLELRTAPRAAPARSTADGERPARDSS